MTDQCQDVDVCDIVDGDGDNNHDDVVENNDLNEIVLKNEKNKICNTHYYSRKCFNCQFRLQLTN